LKKIEQTNLKHGPQKKGKKNVPRKIIEKNWGENERQVTKTGFKFEN